VDAASPGTDIPNTNLGLTDMIPTHMRAQYGRFAVERPYILCSKDAEREMEIGEQGCMQVLSEAGHNRMAIRPDTSLCVTVVPLEQRHDRITNY